MIALLFLFGFSISSPKTIYEPVVGIPWDSCNEYNFNVVYNNTDYPVNYTYCTNTSLIKPEFISEKTPEISRQFFYYINTLSLQPKSDGCQEKVLLEIYEVQYNHLNDYNRYNEWRTEGTEFMTIWGLYDMRWREPSYSAITITNQFKYTEIVLAHEMAHYWADRLCLDQYGVKGEAFARGFEKFYMNQTRY